MQRYLLRLVEVALLCVFILVVALLLALLLKYILPFVIGWVLAILLIPVVRWGEERGLPRMAAVIVVLALLVLLVALFSGGVIVGITREATSLIVNSQSFFARENVWIRHQLSAGKVFYGQLPPQVTTELQHAFQQVVQAGGVGLKKTLTSFLGSFTHLPEILFIAVIAVITSFFILLKHERMMVFFFRMAPPGWEGKLNVVLTDMSNAFLGTIRVQFILMCLSTVLGILGMYVLGIPYALLLGAFFGLAGFIPVLGSAILTIPWALGALVIGDVSLAIKVISLQIVISIIRHIVEPKLLANTVGLDTLSTLFALYVGLKLMGILGLFIGPIILIGVKGLLSTHLFVDFLPDISRQAFDAGEDDDH
jgi:sporulation integral membrane protein YtvI